MGKMKKMRGELIDSELDKYSLDFSMMGIKNALKDCIRFKYESKNSTSLRDLDKEMTFDA